LADLWDVETVWQQRGSDNSLRSPGSGRERNRGRYQDGLSSACKACPSRRQPRSEAAAAFDV